MKRKQKKRSLQVGVICFVSVFILIAISVIFSNRLYSQLNLRYDNAFELLQLGQYEEAYGIFIELEGFRDSKQKAEEARQKQQAIDKKEYSSFPSPPMEMGYPALTK